VQVDPIKPTLKVPGTKRLKVQYDELLSSFPFKFNLRRYIEVREELAAAAAAAVVGRCRLTVSKLELKAPLVSTLDTAI